MPYAGIRSRRCWRLAAPTGSASGMGVTDLDLDPVSRMSESSGSYARVFCMLATASGSPKRTANHGRPVRIAAEISHLIASFRLVGPRIWMGPAFGRRPIPPLSHRDRERPRQWLPKASRRQKPGKTGPARSAPVHLICADTPGPGYLVDAIRVPPFHCLAYYRCRLPAHCYASHFLCER